MRRPTTRNQINHTLKVIGENGLSGIKANGTSVPQALVGAGVWPKQLPASKRYQLVNELKRQELVTITKLDGSSFLFQLSVKGIHRLQQAEITRLVIKPPKIWDTKWRLVMFDVPSHRTESRYILTSSLKRLGFKMIQKSFWVHPYPCFDIAEKIITHANLQDYVSLAEISRLDTRTERQLKRHFRQLNFID